MRAFIGVEFSKDIKDKIIQVQDIIRDGSQKGRWKYIGNFHLTLKFLGEVTKEQMDQIYGSMKKKLDACTPFTVKGEDIGYFKGNGCLRVIYIRLSDPLNSLMNLFKGVEECCVISGIEREKRPYTPHITVAQDVALKDTFENIKNKAAEIGDIEIPVRQVSIIKSEQIEGKRIYTPVRTLELMK